MQRNVLLTVEYDGTGFSGWQVQPNVRTVQGELQEALSKVCGMEIKVDGTSRTDAGVHAFGQRATFSGDFGIPINKIPYAVNNILSTPGKDGDIRVLEAKSVPEGFHARFDSQGKKYRYRIFNGEGMPVFLRNYRYHVRKDLDIKKMQDAAKYMVGIHDFACFQAAGGNPGKTTVRTIYSLEILEENDSNIVIEVSGNGFLYNMVRIITGTLVDVGMGKFEPEKISGIIESKDRRNAGHTAPPQGLYLMEVFYQWK